MLMNIGLGSNAGIYSDGGEGGPFYVMRDFFGTNPFAGLADASFVPAFDDMVSTTLFKFNFKGFLHIGWFTAITLVITFCIIDMFDTIGTLVTGIIFLACTFIAPIAAMIPPAATSSALIYVGVLMVSGLKNVNFEDITQALPPD